MRRVPFSAALALLLTTLQQAGIVRAHDPPSNITFARDIRLLLSEHCATCHVPGGSAPMALTTYDEVRPWARAIREQVLTRRMPKWHAARGYGAFTNDPSLTPHEQALLIAWLDAGMPEGEPRGTVAIRPAAGLPSGAPSDGDVRVIVPARADVGRIASSSSTWITGWTVTPGDSLITAAVISVDGVSVAAWIAGDRPTRLPPGTGFRGGARIRVDVRRRAAAAQEQPFVARASVVTLLTDSSASLRRAWTEQVTCGALRTGQPGELVAVRPLLDRAEARLSIARPGAPAAIVGWFRDFDPLYPRTYWLMRPIEMGPETRLIGEGPCRVELTLAAITARP